MDLNFKVSTYGSLIFYPIGFIISANRGINFRIIQIVGIILLSFMLYYSYNISEANKSFISIVLAINLIAAFYILGLNLGRQKIFDNHFGEINPIRYRWLWSPLLSLLTLYALIVILQNHEENIGYTLDGILEFLQTHQQLSLVFLLWLIYLVVSYFIIDFSGDNTGSPEK